MNNTLSIIEKLTFFIEKKIKVHITKINREFLNGHLISKENESIYVLNEDTKGRTFIFVSDIFDIEEFKERENNRI